MLTTPVIKDDDLVFPGEGWFLYWKTSASLWKTKIEELSGASKIIIPINWSFHSDTGERFDFANEKPETDLKKLSDICQQYDKEVIFLLSLSPMPFLPNGGIPFLLARNNSQNQNGVNKAFADSEGNINQIFSYFDPRIFTAFTRFCHELGTYFSRAGINAGVWGIDCGSFEEGHFHSFIEDFSPVFEKGFSRYVQAKKEDETFASQNIDQEVEANLKKDYQKVIYDLYLSAAEKELSTYWQGVKKYGFLLSQTNDIIFRSIDHISDLAIMDEAISYLSHGVYPSSMLLPTRRKKGIFSSFKNKILSRESIELLYNDKTLTSSFDFCFKPSYMIKVYHNAEVINSLNQVTESGFLKYCDTNFKSNTYFSSYADFNWEDELESGHEYFYFSGKDLNLKRMSSALKMFMNGMNIFIDKNGLDESLQRRLESFYIENDLEIERLRYLTQIETISMGDGRLFIYDSSELVSLENASQKLEQFWGKVFTSLEIEYCEIDAETGIRYVWYQRNVGHNELKYERVKRINIFNPSSYKKKFKIKYPSTYVFQKIIDEENVQLTNTTHEIELSFMPKGSVSLDFGVISK